MTGRRASSAEALLGGLERLGTRLGLEVTREHLAALGRPDRGLPAVLVAGTNGKGSTAALLAAMATAAGYRVGLYTSPHLEEVRERLRLDGRAISEGDLAERLVSVLDVVPGRLPTYFEALTLAAILWFADRGVDLAVLEVGLGGRLDATNAVEPRLSLVTEIGLDHRELLGETLGEIAREKAGVLRRGRLALASVGEPEARSALAAVASGQGALLVDVRRRSRARPVGANDAEATAVEVTTPRGSYRGRLRLGGGHQLGNLVLAVEAAEALAALGLDRLDGAAIESGINACRWPGRLERVVLPEGSEALLDGAHNVAAAVALGRHLERSERRYDLLFGALADKDAEAMLAVLAPAANRVTLTRPPSPRAASPESLAASSAGRGAVVVDDPVAALDEALAPAPRPLVVCGSLYLVGATRRALRERFGIPAAAAELSTYDPPSGS